MSLTLDELRARSQAHQQKVDRDLRFFDVQTLAKRWGVSPTMVRSISAHALPYTNVGTGLQRERRRYHPEAVAAYEAARPRKAG